MKKVFGYPNKTVCAKTTARCAIVILMATMIHRYHSDSEALRMINEVHAVFMQIVEPTKPVRWQLQSIVAALMHAHVHQNPVDGRTRQLFNQWMADHSEQALQSPPVQLVLSKV